MNNGSPYNGSKFLEIFFKNLKNRIAILAETMLQFWSPASLVSKGRNIKVN